MSLSPAWMATPPVRFWGISKPPCSAKLAHHDRRLVRETERQPGSERPLVAQARAGAEAVVVLVVRQVGGIRREGRESRQSLRLEALVGQDGADAESVLASQLVRVGRREEHLAEVDARRSEAEHWSRVIRVHAAVPVGQDGQGAVLADLLVDAKGRHREVPGVALHGPGRQAERAGVAGGRADNGVLAVRVEERQVEVQPAPQEGSGGGVGGDRLRTQRERHAGPGHRLVIGSVPVAEVSIRGPGARSRQHQSHTGKSEPHSESHESPSRAETPERGQAARVPLDDVLLQQ